MTRGLDFEHLPCVLRALFSSCFPAVVRRLIAHRDLAVQLTCTARSSLKPRERQTRKRLAQGEEEGRVGVDQPTVVIGKSQARCARSISVLYCQQHGKQQAARAHRKGWHQRIRIATPISDSLNIYVYHSHRARADISTWAVQRCTLGAAKVSLTSFSAIADGAPSINPAALFVRRASVARL